MDEKEKVREQLDALDTAEQALTGEDPGTDFTRNQIERLISGLLLRLTALVTSGNPPAALSAADQASLVNAMATLNSAVTQSAGAVQILQAATALASA